jgi:hypothetical protein
MAQRNSGSPQKRGPSSSGPAKKAPGKPGAAKPGAPKPGAPKPGTPRTGAPKPSASGPVKRPPVKSGRSIVNQHQRPWGLIITAIVIVVLAAGVITYAATRSGSGSSSAYTVPEIADAKAIDGVIYKAEPNHNHVEGNLTYNTTPPTGGNHSQYWADCSGTVYPNAIANENAVHMLEHGAVWITYKPGLAQDQIDTLSKLVTGQDRMAMSPYPDLKTNISLQSWDYQLFVDSATDPRIEKFILALRFNPKTTPESSATCSQPTFITHPSTFGHPLWTPAT